MVPGEGGRALRVAAQSLLNGAILSGVYVGEVEAEATNDGGQRHQGCAQEREPEQRPRHSDLTPTLGDLCVAV